jgi:hypothetical protein
MAKKTVDAIRRTGTARTPIRQLVVVQGEGKTAVETVLSTPIEKVEWGMQFRFGASPKPVEQYAFKVGGKTVERFADAAALVMKKHHVELAGNETANAQIYVQRATAILEGRDTLRILSEVPEEAKPAIATYAQREQAFDEVGENFSKEFGLE